jgi:hypothetical protein
VKSDGPYLRDRQHLCSHSSMAREWRRRYSRIHVLLIVGTLLGYAAAGNLAQADETAFNDPFAYCVAAGTTDDP